MPKDFKIGMILGLVLIIIGTFWLAIHPSQNPQAETLDSQDVTSLQENTNSQNSLLANGLAAESTKNNQSELPDLTVYEQPQKIKTQKFHIVRKGETLSAISYKYYGSANKWQKILNANHSRINNANRLKPGTKLIIPE